MSEYREALDAQQEVTSDYLIKHYGHIIRKALTLAAEIEEGNKVVVPREPTEGMLAARFDLTGESSVMRLRVNQSTKRIWKAMITAGENK